MTQILDLGKLRFNFAPAWLPDTIYETNDCVRYGGNVYCYTYALKEAGTLPTDTSHWALMVEGISFQGVYDPTVAYRIGHAVSYGAKLYTAIKDNIGTVPPDDATWSVLADGIQYEGVYNAAKPYQRNDVVSYGGQVFIAKVDTTNNLPTNTLYWNKLVTGISPMGVYNAGTAYVPGDVVAYGAHLYINIAESTNILPTVTAKWTLFQSGVKYTGTYSGATSYKIGEIVSYGSGLFRAKSDVPAGTLPTVLAYWDVWMTGMSFQGAWDVALAYKPNDYVTEGSNLYRAKRDVAAGTLVTNAAYWDVVTTGTSYRGDWAPAVLYYKNDIVNRGGQSFIALTRTISGAVFADDLAAGNWVRYTGGVRWRGNYNTLTAYLEGDLVFNGTDTYRANLDFTSGASFAADGANWVMVARGAATPAPLAPLSAAFNPVARGRYLIDTSAGAFSINLPAAPASGDEITFIDAAGTFRQKPLTLLRNGQNIEGAADDMTLNIGGVNITIIFTTPTQGWKLY